MGNSNKENVAIQRLASLFDEGIFTEIDPFAKGENGEVEVVAGYGYVNGTECYAFAQDSNVNSGAVTVAQCAKILKMTDGEIIRGIKKIKQIPNRLECIKSGEKLIIDDSYNSNVVGSKYAINTAKKMGKKVLVVTPGMVELGDIQYNENYLFAKHIGKQCSYLIIVNKINQKALYQGAIDGGMDKENVFFADNLEKTKEIIKQISCDVVLFENDLTDDYK